MGDRYWGKPFRANVWHIFGDDGRCLCSAGWMLTNVTGDKESFDPDSDTYNEGRDCKGCCRAAGLLTENDDGG